MEQWEAKSVSEPSALLGEGPYWHAQEQAIYWLDIPGKQLHRHTPGQGDAAAVDLCEEVGCLVRSRDEQWLCGARSGLAVLDAQSGQTRPFIDPEVGMASRFNDGKIGPDGRFYAGTITDDRSPNAGLYCLEPDGNLRQLLSGVTNSNGLAWDSQRAAFYYIDTPTLRIDAFDFEAETGKLENRRTAFSIAEEDGKPDGMTIDAEGMLWVAHFGGWKVSRWNPLSGEQIGEVRLPVRDITCPTFGGPELDTLYITTTRIKLDEAGLAEQPDAGRLFAAKVGVSGAAPTCFAASTDSLFPA